MIKNKAERHAPRKECNNTVIEVTTKKTKDVV